MKLSEKQLNLAQAISDFTKKIGIAPHPSQMQEILGYNTRQALNQTIIMLRIKGVLKVTPRPAKRGSDLLVLSDNWKRLYH